MLQILQPGLTKSKACDRLILTCRHHHLSSHQHQNTHGHSTTPPRKGLGATTPESHQNTTTPLTESTRLPSTPPVFRRPSPAHCLSTLLRTSNRDIADLVLCLPCIDPAQRIPSLPLANSPHQPSPASLFDFTRRLYSDLLEWIVASEAPSHHRYLLCRRSLLRPLL